MTKRIAFLALLAIWLALPSPAQVGRSFLFPETFTVAEAGDCTAPVRVTLSDGGYPLYHSIEAVVAPSLPATFEFALEGSTSYGIPAASGGGAFYSLSGTIDGSVAANRLVHPIHRLVQWVRFCVPTLTAQEVLTENAFTTHANWDVTGDFSDTVPGGNATYLHSAGSGTLTHADEDFDVPEIGGVSYTFAYTISSPTVGATCNITTSFAAATTALPVTTGAQSVTFTSAATPGDFVISCTSTAGGFTMDDVTLSTVPSIQAIYTGQR